MRAIWPPAPGCLTRRGRWRRSNRANRSGITRCSWGDDASLELPSTSHISIVDAEGNALSMTTTIENGFGSRLFVRGFLLNNELTDFSFATHANGWPIANRVRAGQAAALLHVAHHR